MLFYTGANKNGAIQGNPNLSLGGWISSSQIPNDFLNNLFSDIDYTTVKNDLKPIRVIAFKNLTGSIIPSFKVYTITPPTNHAKFKIGLILNAIDESCSCPYFEQLQSELASPFYVVLNDCEGINNALELINIPIGQYVGIFIQRILIPENNSDYKGKNKTCADFNTEFIIQQAQLLNPSVPDPLNIIEQQNISFEVDGDGHLVAESNETIIEGTDDADEDNIQIVFSF